MDMDPIQPEQTCQFPDCTRPIKARSGPGRPALYCDNGEHNRVTAWRLRHQDQSASSDHVDNDLDLPVTSASARASDLFSRATQAGAHHIHLLEQLLSEFTTLTDHDAAQVEIEAVRAAAEKRIVEAKAKAAKAEEKQRLAQGELKEATEVANEATQRYSAATEKLAQVSQLNEAHDAEVTELRQQLTDAIALGNERDTQTQRDQTRLEASEQRLEELEIVRSKQDARLEQMRQTLAESAALATQQASQVQFLEAEATRLRTELATAIQKADKYRESAMVDQTKSATLAAQLQSAESHANQRVIDQRDSYELRLDDQRQAYEIRLNELQRRFDHLATQVNADGSSDDLDPEAPNET